ncbi:MAG: flagellar type III secretion system pore protein FliP [Candidatus Eisenbacteria bacterium]
MTAALQLVAALAVTLGALLLTLRALGRLKNGGTTAAPLRVLQRIETAPRQSIAFVQVLDRVLVVALGEGGGQLLAELDEAERARVLASRAPQPLQASDPGAPVAGLQNLATNFQTSLARALKSAGLGALLLGALLLVAPAARAQAPAVKAAKPAAAAKASPVAPAGAMSGPTVNAPLPPKVDVRIGSGAGAMQMTGTVGLVVFIGFLTLLPAIVLLMTSFTRILIVLHFLRSALGTQTTPPSQLLAAIAILLTSVIMNPVLQRTQRDALQPFFDGRITQVEAYQRGIVPFREFMLTHTRDKDLEMFAEAGGSDLQGGAEKLPIVAIISAFVTSELRTAFQMGFALFLPFVVVDVVVASVLMSLGMFMLPPAMISLPFKLLLFVLADGWSLVFQNLIASFR